MLRCAVVLLGMFVLPVGLRAQDVTYRVVVHKSNSVARLSRDQVSKIFLRKVTLWDNRRPVLPVDQAAESPVRRAFTQQVHQRTIASVQTWWQQQIFTGGEVPPPERATDSQVMEYIRKNPSAIGYIRAGVPVSPNVKTVDVSP